MKAKTIEQVRAIVENVSFKDRTFRVLQKGDGFLLQLEYFEADIETGKVERQRARKWYLSPYSTETEIVETAFKACRTSMEHVLKEHFLYEGQRVYSPHFNIRARVDLAEHRDYDGRDHTTSLEVIPTPDPNEWGVFVAGERLGSVTRTRDIFVGVVKATGKTTPPLPTKTKAARALAAMSR